MSKAITDQPEDATPLDDISGLLRDDITNRKQLDEADEADWDVYWEDESKTQAAQSDEMADYDELDD